MPSRQSTLFDDVPGPSPWYVGPATRTVEGFRWQSAGEEPGAVGKTLLVGANGPVMILDFRNYAMMLDESSLLVWHQRPAEAGTSAPVRLLVIQPHLLSPLGNDLNSLYRHMSADHVPIAMGGAASAEIILSTVDAAAELRAEFPSQLLVLDELLILCSSSAIDARPFAGSANLALLVARPRESTYRLYPQDWFNSGDYDFGYEWVTRVKRDPSTGYVHGEGVRISPFVLDDSLRKLRRPGK